MCSDARVLRGSRFARRYERSGFGRGTDTNNCERAEWPKMSVSSNTRGEGVQPRYAARADSSRCVRRRFTTSACGPFSQKKNFPAVPTGTTDRGQKTRCPVTRFAGEGSSSKGTLVLALITVPTVLISVDRSGNATTLGVSLYVYPGQGLPNYIRSWVQDLVSLEPARFRSSNVQSTSISGSCQRNATQRMCGGVFGGRTNASTHEDLSRIDALRNSLAAFAHLGRCRELRLSLRSALHSAPCQRPDVCAAEAEAGRIQGRVG